MKIFELNVGLSELLWLVVSTVILASMIRYVVWRLSHRFPPGPWGLPLVGYKPFISKVPFEDYRKLRQKYGDIFGFRLGTLYTVVLNDFADIKNAYNREEFLDRPPGWFQFSKEHDNVGNMNGWEWKETRRFVVTSLRNLGVGRNRVEQVIKEEIGQLLKQIEKAEPEVEWNLMDTIYLPLLNVILTIICGRTFDDGKQLLKSFQEYNEDILKNSYITHRQFYWPFLKPYWWFKNILQQNSLPSMSTVEQFVRKEAKIQEEQFDENNLDNFIAYYLNEMKKNTSKNTSQEAVMTYPNLYGNSLVLLFAGTDTTRISMIWVLLYLALYQEAQQRMYEEIVALLGKEQLPSWENRDEMPFTNAFILETARVKTLAAADDPHWSVKDGTVGGIFIPKHTMILANVEAVHMDKKLWGDPENFRPERFLSSDGKKVTTPEYWIPFLIGKRSCPGAKLANMQLFLFVTSLVQRFQVVSPKSGLSLDFEYFFMNFPKKPIVSFKSRS